MILELALLACAVVPPEPMPARPTPSPAPDYHYDYVVLGSLDVPRSVCRFARLHYVDLVFCGIRVTDDDGTVQHEAVTDWSFNIGRKYSVYTIRWDQEKHPKFRFYRRGE
jgi:hypothetical protein